MYWLRQPPYLRWIAAGLVLVAGILYDTRPTPVVPYPFAAEQIDTGQQVDPAIEWRDVPAGVLPEWTAVVTGLAINDIPAGTPVLPSLITTVDVPEDWWVVPLPLPQRVPPGTPIRVALEDEVVEGLIVGEPTDTGFELSGSVAFPSEDAARVAIAAGDNALVVMIGTERRLAESAG